jgi:NAD(P)H dehydrogenase (quinone)
MKVNVIFYSLYGHVYRLAEAIAEGAREVQGADVALYQVAETFSPEVLAKMGAVETKKMFAHVPVADVKHLAEADCIFFGAPTRFGMVPAQMQAFMDRTGGLWSKDALVGKVGSVFTSSGTQHGGQESTILHFQAALLHHGMVIVGCPYAEKRLSQVGEMSGGSPYGASTIAGKGRLPSENELAIARYQGRFAATIAAKLAG